MTFSVIGDTVCHVAKYAIYLDVEDNSIKMTIINENDEKENMHPATRKYWLERVLLAKLNKMYKAENHTTTHLPGTLSLVDTVVYQVEGSNR